MAWTDEMVEELKRLWAEGVTTGEIGRRLNISKNSIVGKVHRLGLSGRPSPIKKKSDEDEPQPVKTTDKEKTAKKPAPVKEIKEPAKEVPAIKSVSEPKKETVARPEKKAPVQHIPETPVINEEDDIKLAKSINISASEPCKKEHLSLTDLDNHTCRWPIGDPKDDNFHFCGKKVRLGQTYCEEHSAVAYVKPGKK